MVNYKKGGHNQRQADELNIDSNMMKDMSNMEESRALTLKDKEQSVSVGAHVDG